MPRGSRRLRRLRRTWPWWGTREWWVTKGDNYAFDRMQAALPFVTNPVRRSKLYPTPDEAETAFYDAFERGDLAAMMSVWAESDAVVCVHPRGPRLVGFDAVRDSWTQIFAGGTTQLRIKSTELRKFDGQNVAVHTLVEVLTAPG